MRHGEEQLDKRPQRVVERLVSVESEAAEVDVVAAQRRLEHGEADADALEPLRVHLVLGEVWNGQYPLACLRGETGRSGECTGQSHRYSLTGLDESFTN